MMSILRIWREGAHRNNLSTKKQAMMPQESVGYIDLADAQLEAVSGGYGQDQDQSYRQQHSKTHHKPHHWHNQWHNYGSNPNFGSPSQYPGPSFHGHW